MRIEINEDLIYVFAIILVIVLVIAGCYFSAKATCSAKAQALGYEHDYKFYQGCLLTKPDGQKVLLEQIRDYK